MAHVGSRYRNGFVIAMWDTCKDGVFPADDHVIKRLCVIAEPGDASQKGEKMDLVGYVEVEVVSIENGEDDGFIHGPAVEVYRMPFPHDVSVRKTMLRAMRDEPKFYVH